MNELLVRLADLPAVQAGLVAASSLFSEDAAIVGSGLLVAGGDLAFLTAWIGLALGIALGDLLLYALGRLAGPRVRQRGWIDPRRLERASGWFARHGAWVLVLARCVPGLRFPTFLAAGILEGRARSVVPTMVLGAALWSLVALHGLNALGSALLPHLGQLRWLALLPIGIVAVNVLGLRRLRRTRPVAPPADLVPVEVV